MDEMAGTSQRDSGGEACNASAHNHSFDHGFSEFARGLLAVVLARVMDINCNTGRNLNPVHLCLLVLLL